MVSTRPMWPMRSPKGPGSSLEQTYLGCRSLETLLAVDSLQVILASEYLHIS